MWAKDIKLVIERLEKHVDLLWDRVIALEEKLESKKSNLEIHLAEQFEAKAVLKGEGAGLGNMRADIFIREWARKLVKGYFK